ncbi:MAG: phosphoribosyl transferase [Spirochaetes bacterium GWD1_61_31]|nr:MAG: phosphoribosyl transferase [Spirochaetes bacterium GWB1_60_80]OHD29603.1 MAG: phosphoribosyl transferase [Spirochaetes bacterium GWC1_61_12]OHD37506.1 MAG: phosphoribosyl transferase [Spirochaetes bacterium GWD1_61_31]OHD41984.1 MAG: phosphoribosyl transferase [Spirochaetes bacterium GWE1_60_18]OHD61750.1 MAG: phosphoribosyl transferase [Spirochaetes bacterium GWF1_60_12]
MNKEFISYDSIRNNALKLAHRIATDGFIPDVIYVSLRGGAYLGNVMSEYFKLVRSNDRPVFYAAVVARSYTDVREQEQVRVDGWTYSPEFLRTGDRVLLVDDIFDSGRTINHLANIILEHGVPRKHLKIAVHDYKVFKYKTEELPIQPDYWCRYHELASPADEKWIHYMSHELVGLTEQELLTHYYPEDPELRQILALLKK